MMPSHDDTQHTMTLSSADYALKVIFSQFEHVADVKMTLILNMGVDTDVDLKKLLGHGSDDHFDRLICSLASLAATQQSAVIDAVMRWRKLKVEPLDPTIIKRVSESAPLSRSKEIQSVLKERQSLASVFILCRTLIEIIRRLTPGSLPDDLGENLEEIVFNQLKKADPDAIKRSKNRTASMDLFAELIGELSNIRFASVSDRFIAELEKYNSQTIMKERQGHMEMLIKGMRYLKIKIYPLDALEETADFLSSCALFFKNAHGAKVKHTYARLFTQLLLPIAKVAMAEVNFPSWAKAVDLMYPRALKMTLKPRHVLAGYPLVTTLLCVSRKEFFLTNWTSVLESCYQKLNKDKYTRSMALGCISRLTWTYLFRCVESTPNTFKRLDTIIKTIFPPYRRAVHPSDTPLDHFILITYFALMRDLEAGTKKVLFYLLNHTDQSHSWDTINPERMIIALSAFRCLLHDLEQNRTKPPFPDQIDMTLAEIPMATANVFSAPIRALKPEVTDRVEEIVSKTWTSLDQTLGRLWVLDEKNIMIRTIVQSPPLSPTLPNMATSSSTQTNNYVPPLFSENGPQIHHQYPTFSVSYTKDKQVYFDVIRTILDGMPRIMPAGIPLRTMVDMLSRYTVHTDPDIIQSASQALLRMAAQIDGQTVVMGYSQFICKIEDKFSDVLQSLAHGLSQEDNKPQQGGIFKLYVDLLAIWVHQLEETSGLERPMNADARDSVEMNLGKLRSLIKEIEATGLLYLCHQSATMRRLAIQIFEKVSQLKERMRLPYQTQPAETSMMDMLECIDPKDLVSSTLERKVGTLIQLATSDHPSDMTLWYQCLPELFKQLLEKFPQSTAECRHNICQRLIQIQPHIAVWIETIKASGTTGTLSMAKNAHHHPKAANQETMEQWRIYLIFACATMVPTVVEAHPSLNLPLWHVGRKGPPQIQQIQSPRDLFRLILPYLTCEQKQIRTFAIEGLGSIHPQMYPLLMIELEAYIKMVLDDGKQRNNQKPYQNKRSKKHDRLRISLMHLLDLTVHCLSQDCLKDKHLMNSLMSYIKETKSFLMDSEVQLEWEYQRLRIYLCGLVDQLYDKLLKLEQEDVTLFMSFETRLSLYKMFEEWCGYGLVAKTAQQREAMMVRDVLEQCKDPKERALVTQSIEEDKKALELASLNAMATLCRGPLYAYLGQKKARQAIIQFDTLNVLKWIDATFESREPKYHAIARRALEAVMMYNQDQSLLLDDIIEQCYAGNPKLEFTQGYFQALASIVTQFEDYPCHVHQIISLALFKTGDGKKLIRKTAIQLLRCLEERVFDDSCAKEYEIGITSSLPAIYKHTQQLLSARLALDHPEQTFAILSELTQRFEHISPNSQREVLTYMIPWYRKVDLMVGPHDTELSASAYMVLSNLYYLTVKFGDIYVKETAALWSQLVEYGRNVHAIIMFMLDMGQELRNPWFLIHAKRVFVCLGRTHAFVAVTERIVSEITPRAMVPQVKEVSRHHHHAFPSLFIADLTKVLADYPKKPVFSRGQLAMVVLVDLAIEAGADLAPHLPLLLHCIFVQLDHLTSIVCDQSRCFLINLMHSIVVRQQDESHANALEIIHWLMQKEGKRLWAYENITANQRRIGSAEALYELLKKVVDVFSHQDPDLRQRWGETALKWATCCSVRHLACRSFQCFRALMPHFNHHMLADMLARLSNTMADPSPEIRGFALEIILTLIDVARAMDRATIAQFPQLFWAAVACLYSPFESEHGEGLVLLTVVLDKLDFTESLADSFPKNWSSEFDGLQPLLLKGLQFTSAEKDTFRLLQSISLYDNLALIDPTETRLMYLLLGCLPRLLHGLDHETIDAEALELATTLTKLCENYGLVSIQRILTTYPIQKAKFQEDYLKQILGSMRDVFLNQYSREAFMFCLLMVKNKLGFYPEKTLLMVENLVPYITGQMFQPPVSIDIVALEPLLQLVPTEFSDRALAILNSGIETLSASEGEAEELIWGHVGFSSAAKTTRHNIHAVVFECSSLINEAPIEHDIQFSVEDVSLLTGEMKPMVETKPLVLPMHSTTMNTSANYGDDLMNALKDLDDFFNEEGEPASPQSSQLYMMDSFEQTSHA